MHSAIYNNSLEIASKERRKKKKISNTTWWEKSAITNNKKATFSKYIIKLYIIIWKKYYRVNWKAIT